MSRRSLLPREHGAYAQALLPQAAALGAGGIDPGAAALAAAVIGAFLLHEPALVLAGRRGARAGRELGSSARTQVVVLAAFTVACGVAGMALVSPAARTAALIVLAAGAVAAWFAVRGREKSAAGELWTAATFSAAAVPTALAAGVDPLPAGILALVWTAAFGLSILAVRAVISRHKSGDRTGPALVLASATLAWIAALVIAVRAGGPWTMLPAVVPPALVSAGVLAAGIGPRRLRAMGWTMAAANVLALAVLLVAVRSGAAA